MYVADALFPLQVSGVLHLHPRRLLWIASTPRRALHILLTKYVSTLMLVPKHSCRSFLFSQEATNSERTYRGDCSFWSFRPAPSWPLYGREIKATPPPSTSRTRTYNIKGNIVGLFVVLFYFSVNSQRRYVNYVAFDNVRQSTLSDIELSSFESSLNQITA